MRNFNNDCSLLIMILVWSIIQYKNAVNKVLTIYDVNRFTEIKLNRDEIGQKTK